VIHVPALSTHTMDKEIRFSWLAPGVWPTTIAAISEGLVNMEPLISTSVPLSQAAQAIVDLKARTNDPVKVQIVP
jgi:threonine dehydrogenase-like Zn-dependent dehydrogenase